MYLLFEALFKITRSINAFLSTWIASIVVSTLSVSYLEGTLHIGQIIVSLQIYNYYSHGSWGLRWVEKG